MKHFWVDDIHYNLFEEEEHLLISKYKIDLYISGYKLIGLIGWDEFLLEKDKKYFKVPTVPIDINNLEEISDICKLNELTNKESIYDKIKWYTKPIVFGGNPKDEKNIIWVDIEQHIKLVTFWNNKYSEYKTE